MKRRMLILLTLCAFACAMVVRNKRNATISTTLHCAPSTPCAWQVYGVETRIVESTITNQYCKCDPSTSCQMYMDDTEGFFHVYRCMPLVPTTTES